MKKAHTHTTSNCDVTFSNWDDMFFVWNENSKILRRYLGNFLYWRCAYLSICSVCVCVSVVLSLIANLFFIQFNPHTQAPVTIRVILSSSIAASNKLCAVSYVDQIYDCIVSIMVPYHIIVFGISIHVNQFVKFYKQHMKVCAWLLARSPCLVCIALSNWTK